MKKELYAEMKKEIDADEWEDMSVDDRNLYLRLCFENFKTSQVALLKASHFPNFGLTLINFISEYSLKNITKQVADTIIAAHIHFRHHLQSKVIGDSEMVKIKPTLLTLLCTTGFRVFRDYCVDHLLEIADDFPVDWPNVLNELTVVQETTKNDYGYNSINGLLAAINALCMKFMTRPVTHQLLIEYFSQQLEWIFRDNCAILSDQWVSLSPGIFEQVIESQRLCCKIFYSFMMNMVPEYFNRTIHEWVPQLLTYLRADLFKVKQNTDGVDLIDGLRIAACEVLFLFAEKQQELFEDYLRRLVDAVRSLLVLVVASESSSQDQLAEMAFKFLWEVKKHSIEDLFDRDNMDDVLQQMCEEIVLPYVMVRDEDEELFDKDYDGFIHRDMQDSGPVSYSYTSRRIACDLLYVSETSCLSQSAKKVSKYIKAWFNTFAQNLDVNWKHKECAMYVVMSLANKRNDGKAQSSHLIEDVQVFFSSLVVPELQSQYIDKFPMLKARALEFFIIFRFLIPKPTALTLLPDVVRLLRSDSNVVHSYAAGCIEVLLGGKGDRGFTSADISPYLLEMMRTLLEALEKKGSNKNPYIMKCIARVLRLADISVEVADLCVNKLLLIFEGACNDSTDCVFNWNLFEAIDVLLRKPFETKFSYIQSYEKTLFPNLIFLLAESGMFEFYTYNLLCQLVELHKFSLPTCYGPIFRNLLLPKSYDRAHYIQEVQVRLFKTFFEMAPPSFLSEGEFKWLSDMFVELGTKRGFQMLIAVVNNIEFDVLAEYMNNIWGTLFSEFYILPKTKQREFSESFVVLMSRFVLKFGPEKFVESMSSFDAGIFSSVIEEFWIPNLKIIRCPLEQELSSVASTRLICESHVFLDPLTDRIWGGMLDSIVTLLSQAHEDKILSPQQQDRFKEDPEVGYHIVETYVMTKYAETYNDRKKEDEDHLKDRIKNAEQLQVASLASFFVRFPKRCMRVIRENLCKENQASFFKFCRSHGYHLDDA